MSLPTPSMIAGSGRRPFSISTVILCMTMNRIALLLGSLPRACACSPPSSRLLARSPFDLDAQALFLRAKLGRELFAEVVRFEHGTNLELALFARHRIGTAASPFDRFLDRPDLPEPEARDELLGFGERSVDDGALASRELDALALRARMETFAREHDARLDQLLVVLA